MKSSQKKIRQHYVPRFYLKHFARQKKSKEYVIRCFNKETRKKIQQNIRQVAMERYFYDDGDPPEIEDTLSHLEGLHSKAYHKIIKNQSLEEMTLYDKAMICHYIMIQNERTRSARARNAQLTELIYKDGEHGIDLPPFESLDNDYKEWLLESRAAVGQINIMLKPIEMEDGTIHYPLEVIFKMVELEWILLKNTMKLEFYTSDHPVFVYNPPIKENEMIRGFGMAAYTARGVEIYFPLTPHFCLVLFDKEVSEYKNFGLKKDVKHDELDWINTQIIAMAHRTIFSQNNDFQFVRECIEKFPELKNLNRIRL